MMVVGLLSLALLALEVGGGGLVAVVLFVPSLAFGLLFGVY